MVDGSIPSGLTNKSMKLLCVLGAIGGPVIWAIAESGNQGTPWIERELDEAYPQDVMTRAVLDKLTAIRPKKVLIVTVAPTTSAALPLGTVQPLAGICVALCALVVQRGMDWRE